MNYRSEIDGLRAVAIIPVILFHAGYEYFAGGFVGVDVFFVVSGYLISNIILLELSQKGFRFRNFYSRRCKRLLPIIFLVTLSSYIAALCTFPPVQLKDFFQSVMAVASFTPNILFFLESGYFDQSSELKPLLHTWSLAIEEQFYILFPLILFFFHNYPKGYILKLFIVLALISLIYSEYFLKVDKHAAFYLSPFRFYELLVGACVALIRVKVSSILANTLASLGLTLILSSIFIFDSTYAFPGFNALLPTFGTGLLILFVQPRSIIHKILSSRLMQLVGLMSFSLYMWHHPIFTFSRIHFYNYNWDYVRLVSILFTVIVSYISWKYFEIPLRKSKISEKSTIIFSLLALTALFCLGAFSIKVLEKNTSQFDIDSLKLSQCETLISIEYECLQSNNNSDKHVLIIGDSHAKTLGQHIPNAINTRFTIISKNGCPPIKGASRFDNGETAKNCNSSKGFDRLISDLEELKPDYILLSARWPMYLNGLKKHGKLKDDHHFVTFGESNVNLLTEVTDERLKSLQEGIQNTIKELSFAKLAILISPYDLADVGYLNINRNARFSQKAVSLYNSRVKEIFEDIKVPVFDAQRLFCDENDCRVGDGFGFFYNDDNHLSNYGVKLFWENYLINKFSVELNEPH